MSIWIYPCVSAVFITSSLILLETFWRSGEQQEKAAVTGGEEITPILPHALKLPLLIFVVIVAVLGVVMFR